MHAAAFAWWLCKETLYFTRKCITYLSLVQKKKHTGKRSEQKNNVQKHIKFMVPMTILSLFTLTNILYKWMMVCYVYLMLIYFLWYMFDKNKSVWSNGQNMQWFWEKKEFWEKRKPKKRTGEHGIKCIAATYTAHIYLIIIMMQGITIQLALQLTLHFTLWWLSVLTSVVLCEESNANLTWGKTWGRIQAASLPFSHIWKLNKKFHFPYLTTRCLKRTSLACR